MIINWQQFGLKKNPYDTLPLIEGGEIPIQKAFEGREAELQYLDGLFLSNDTLCLTICGNVGVGKTSLINFHKFIFKHSKQEKLLFSFRREIEAFPDMMNKRSFLIEIIGSVLRELHFVDPDMIKKNDLLQRLQKIVDISQSINFSFGLSGGFDKLQLGGDFGRDAKVEQPIQLAMSILEQYYIDLIEFIRKNPIGGKKYHGLIIHVNNFDVLLNDANTKKAVIHFFQEIRDMMQYKNTYFVFLGPRHFFREIISQEQRVKSIFVQTPLMLSPLSKQDIVKTFNERMQLLKSDDVQEVIKPFEDEVMYRLYDLFNGDIRSIMSALKDILSQCSYTLGRTLTVDEAMMLLGRERWERIEASANLTEEQLTILKHLASSADFVTQKDVGELLNLMKNAYTIATLGSHSSLQILKGAKDEGFQTLLVTTRDREAFYKRFSFIDDIYAVSSFTNFSEIEKQLKGKNVILIPHGSFVAHLGIEGNKNMQIPYFGNKKVLDWEADRNKQQEWLTTAEIAVPRHFKTIDGAVFPVIVKTFGAEGGNGYFYAKNKKDFEAKIKRVGAKEFVIQQYIIGVTAYIHYFYSPISGNVEIMSMDRRYETNADGLGRISLEGQEGLSIEPSYVVVGNTSLILRESLLPEVYAMGERIVAASKKLIDTRGLFGPFCLETIITPDQKFYAMEISCRIVAGTNIFTNGSSYSWLTYDEPMSTGRRIAREIKMGIEGNKLERVLD